MRTFAFVLVALVASGCHWDLNTKSTDPQTDQLYFPAGIVMDPNGQFVYVSNGNADLRYGGGTVEMIDMLSFECTVAALPRASSPVDLRRSPTRSCRRPAARTSTDQWMHRGLQRASAAATPRPVDRRL